MINSMSFLVEDQILSKAIGALALKSNGLDPKPLSITTNASGACLLYPSAFFPWGGLPYPLEHAKLANALIDLNQQDIAQKLATFQAALCDHDGHPIPTVFCQEGKVSYHELEQQTRMLFSKLQQKHVLEFPFVDHDIGLVRHGDEHTTNLITASGCVTGLGSFLFKDAGVLTFGPQLSPIGDCSGFGIAGKPSNWTYESHHGTCSYTNRLSIAHLRQTGISFLADAGYSGLWLNVQHQICPQFLTTQAVVIGPNQPKQMTWALFAKARTCVVAHSHKLSENSLDRYQGPVQLFELIGNHGIVEVDIKHADKMEVIPLAGDESFWGANFLIAIQTTQPAIEWVFNRSSSLL